jgi:hypothetical protein
MASAGGKKTKLWIGSGAAIVELALFLFLSRGGDDAPAIAAAPAPAMIDLSQIPDVERLEGTNDGDWAAMNEMMARYVAPESGQNAQQYGDRLMIKGRYAVPAILNGFKRIDLTTQHGADVGWKIQTMLLQGLCKDTNFGWHRNTRPEGIAFNQKVIQQWFECWKFAGDDDELWTEIAKHKGIPPGLEKQPAAEKPAEAADTTENAGM